MDLGSGTTQAFPSVNLASAPHVPAAASGPVITYVPGSTGKLEQLLGEEDKERHQVLSTWNPYVVVLMKSRLHVE